MNETPGVGDEPIMGPDLVNGPNPWLPAYGFQIQHQIHASLQSAHEDLRANDTMLVQQVDYLETILEETSDDLQSDSDRSGTTYWLGSDSETESVIHIKTNQRLADDKLDGSGSETNSVVPKKRRRKNDTEALESSTTFGEDFAMSPRSPRSSRSSESSRSSRSSSLVQFESLERTCATLSPSSFSFDSLEYANRTNLSRLDTTSPDSLEQDYDRVVPNGHSGIEYTRIRPYRSFESLDTVGQKEDHGKCNGFVPSLFSKRNEDLSDGRRDNFQKRNVWRSDDYDDEDDYDEEDELSDEDGPRIFDSDSFKDRLLVFGDSSTNYATSLDCRNTTDLREIGLESKQDAFLELKKSGRSATPTSLRLTKLNITGNMAPQHQHRSDESGFNFSAMDKSQSAPSLALGATEFAARQSFFSASSRCLADVRRVASAPDLESYERDDEEDLSGEMSETMTITLEEEPRCEPESRTVRTQELPSRSQIVAINDPPRCEEEDDETPVMEEKPVTSTVRTQDRIESVLEMVLDNDLGQELVNNLAREVEDAKVQRSESGRSRKVKNNASYELAQQLEVDDRVAKSLRSKDDGPRASPRKKMVNNASYELAQQCDYIRVLQSKNFRRMDACEEEEERPLDYTRSAGNISNARPNHARVYSKSTDNVSQEGLIAQIKKNSDLFSLYGDNGRPLSGPVEDDVDFCCLETKPIEKSESLSSSRPSWRSGDEGAPEEASPQGDRALKGKGLSGLERGVQASPPERMSQRERLSSNPTAEAQHGDADSSTEASPVRADMSAAAARRLAKADSSAASSTTTLNGSERKKTGFGGFLQRFSKLRFSGRSKVPRSELHKKSAIEPKSAHQTQVINKKEPDYIIIPLHPPEEDKTRHNDDSTNEQTYNVSSANGRPPVYSKPPLPPQPPRLGALAGKPPYVSRRRAVTDLGNPTAIEMAKARTMQVCQDRPVGLLETDLDAPEEGDESAVSATSAGKKTRSLLNLNQSGHPRATGDLATDNALHVPQSPSGAAHRTANDANHNQRPHKSMEFLLDKENLHFVKPPENELQKVGERVPSEHELRVQRSLQRLNVPDWYKNSPAARDGFRLKRHSDASQHSGWRALGSKTTSLSSLSSSSTRQPTTATLLSPSPTPPVFSRWSTSLLNSAGNSPANSARSSFNHRQPYLGWRSQERLTNPRTPAERLAQGLLQSANKQQQTTNQQQEVRNSIKEVTSAIVHYVQSGQESVGGGGRLSPRPRPDDWDERGGARSTSPRGSGKLCWMESSFVGSRPVDSPETPMSLATEAECCTGCSAPVNEPCSCVDSSTTSALYLDLTPTQDDTSLKYLQGSGSLCLSPSSNYQKHHRQQHHHHHHHQQSQQQHHRGSGQSDTDEAMATAALLRNKPSPGSTTLEDVLDSLLGLPSASRTPSPGPGPISGSTSNRRSNANAGKSCSDLRQDLQESARSVMDISGPEDRAGYFAGEMQRRKSEGSDSIPSRSSLRSNSNTRQRRVSFDNAQENGGFSCNMSEKLVRCRNNKCSNSTSLAEAKRSYKSCHNCTCLYCSRECRRAHWQRHRKTCLHSRAGTLCRQVLSASKEDPATLKHISSLARRGFTSHGRGAVKCFFTSPEAAEKFVNNGFVDLGETTYVRWSDVQPTEMGVLYAEFSSLCESYNPDNRLVLYVALCVVSEVPTSGAVKWERQLVSRCAKMKLDPSCRQTSSPRKEPLPAVCNITREMESPETLVLTSLPLTNGQGTPKKAREVSFSNIQRQLKLRGVSLRRHFPQVYKKLCSYVDGSVDKFAPVTIYPRDQASGKSFMCIIMLDAEPERLQLLPTDSSRVRTVDISIEQE